MLSLNVHCSQVSFFLSKSYSIYGTYMEYDELLELQMNMDIDRSYSKKLLLLELYRYSLHLWCCTLTTIELQAKYTLFTNVKLFCVCMNNFWGNSGQSRSQPEHSSGQNRIWPSLAAGEYLKVRKGVSLRFLPDEIAFTFRVKTTVPTVKGNPSSTPQPWMPFFFL